MASGTDTHNALFQQHSSRFTFFWECMQRNKGQPGLLFLGAESMPGVVCVCVCVCVCDGVYFGHAWTPERFPLLCSVCDFSLLVIFSLACAGASSSDSQIFLSFCNSPPAFYSPKSFVLTPRGAGFPLSKRGKKINKYIFFLKSTVSITARASQFL